MPRVVATAVRTVHGDLEATARAVESGVQLFRPAPWARHGYRNPRTALVDGRHPHHPAEQLLLDVLQAVSSRFEGRVALVVATSTGNLTGVFEQAAANPSREPPIRAGRDGPAQAATERFGFVEATTLSVACISGTAAFRVAWDWLSDEVADQVVVAGVDAIGPFVHAGFSGLGALASGLPKPFQSDRDGLLLGDGAAAILLERGDGFGLKGLGWAGESYHPTAPDPTARGARAAVAQALEQAGVDAAAIRCFSPHATGTQLNDTMELHLLEQLFDPKPDVQLVKASTGHSLGAAGAVEAALVLRERTTALSISSAFGGMNAAAVFADGTDPSCPEHAVREERLHPLDDATDVPTRLHRGDDYVRRGLALVLAEHAREPLTEGTALILAARETCDETDRTYFQRLLREGPERVSRREFIGTLPASPLLAARLHLGLTGPVAAFVDEGQRAVRVGRRWIRHGHATSVLALDLGDTPHSIRLWRHD